MTLMKWQIEIAEAIECIYIRSNLRSYVWQFAHVVKPPQIYPASFIHTQAEKVVIWRIGYHPLLIDEEDL